MKKSWIVPVIVTFGMLILLGACGGDSEKPKYTEGQELTLSGKIKIIDNDGTFYVLVTENNEFFEIPNLDDKYKVEEAPIKAVLKINKLRTLTGLGPSCEVIEYLE
jgi:hypothetical protein